MPSVDGTSLRSRRRTLFGNEVDALIADRPLAAEIGREGQQTSKGHQLNTLISPVARCKRNAA